MRLLSRNVRRQYAEGYVIRIVAPVRDEGQDPVEFGARSKRSSGGSLGSRT